MALSSIHPTPILLHARGYFRYLATMLLWTAAALTFYSCGNDNYKELPPEIQQFITTYFPGEGISGYNESAGTYTVNLDNSASIVFNPSLQWVTLDGNGNSLPRQFLFDQFPSTLYGYIETTDNLGEVYSVTRNAGIYTVTFHGYIITYNTVSGEIRPVVISPEENG